MIRVGFLLNIDENWLGGLNYFRNLIGAITSTTDSTIVPVIFTGKKTDKRFLDGLGSVEVIETPVNDRGNIFGLLRKIDKKVFDRDRLIDGLAKKHNIDIFSHLTRYLGRLETPTIGWIPDFQHIHLPHMFKPRELLRRDKTYRQMCANYTSIIVSSFDAKKDLYEFAPEYTNKAHVLRFVTEPPAGQSERVFHDIKNLYSFTTPFFYVPNQYWQHKNHLVILQALAILKKSGRNVLVISTGNTGDHRNPGFFESLQEYIKSNGLTSSYRILGTVPYAHVISLAMNCTAFINPSLFEGWSTTVEEAKSLGKKIILSNIPVHKEQNPREGKFFDPYSPEELAELMWEVWNETPNSNKMLAEEGLTILKQRRASFARTFEQIVLDSLS